MFKKIVIPMAGIVVGSTLGVMTLKYSTSLSGKSINASRKIVNTCDKSGLQLALYQYQTCPFCSKTRAFLDYYGFSYEIIETNPITKSQIKFSDYKKVPILIAKGQDNTRIVDSSLITSVLRTYLINPKQKLSEILKYYPMDVAINDGSKKAQKSVDYFNKYDIMYGSEINKEQRSHEKFWRKWVDDYMVHLLSPNLYRTLSESYETFCMFSKAGQWETNFSKLENLSCIYIGCVAMYMLGKKLKTKYHLKDDVRESLYDGCNKWLDTIKSQQTIFMGGNNPDLADLAMYGILHSFEGTQTFNDMMKHTNMHGWYIAIKEQVNEHKGSKYMEKALSQ